MSKHFCLALFVLFTFGALCCQAQKPRSSRLEAEYYVAAYARHFGLPIQFVRALIQQESGWRPCAISRKGAVGLMQLMPLTAARLGVRNPCDIRQNVSGGVLYLAWLRKKFRGDWRLVAAGYIAGEDVVARRGLAYSNPEVVAYVSRIRASFPAQPMRKKQGNSTTLASGVFR